ncbi:MAG TPA: hypothetical protein DCS07_17330, partial [Bdellovibrionales bacterium]|nr:hypothetical protein [Bdellovibrionales bacterium]
VLYVGPPSSFFERCSQVLVDSVQHLQVWQFQKPDLLIAHLAEHETNPWLVVIDSEADEGNMEALDWIKSHSAFHFTPVIALTGNGIDSSAKGISRGAFGCIKSFENCESFEIQLKRRIKLELNSAELLELDQIFQDELVSRVESCMQFLEKFDEQNIRRMSHAFHTIKGSAKALEFPALASFMHSAEGFMEQMRLAGGLALPKTQEIIRAILSYLKQSAEAMSARTLLPAPAPELMQVLAGAADVEIRQQVPTVSMQNLASPQRQTSYLRISEEKLNELETRLRHLLEIRMRMNRFSHQLKSEFSDEPFVGDLEALVEELQKESADSLELIMNLRLVPVLRLKAFAERVLFETTLQLNKVARLDYQSPQALAVEPRIFECLENAALHLIRNAVDHGLEDIEIRARTGKDPIGRMGLEFREFGPDKIMAVFEDDGRGIDIEGIRSAVVRRGALTSDTLDKMKPQEIAQLVFSENLSTLQVPSEISGRGIGLSLVKQQISELGGIIELYFEEGRGSRFTVVLPRVLKTK